MHKVPADGPLDDFRMFCPACAFQESQKSIPVSVANESHSSDAQKSVESWEVGRDGVPEETQRHRENESELQTWWANDVDEISSSETIQRIEKYVQSLAWEEATF